jgi:hypothetical protein
MKATDDDNSSMQLVLGYLGLVNAVLLAPVLIFMACYNLGNVRDLTLTALFFIFISGFFDDVISDYLWGRSILLTSPTVATVGLTLTIPLAILVDYISPSFSQTGTPPDLTSGNPASGDHADGSDSGAVHARLERTLSLLGAMLVIVGFLFVNLGCEGDCNLCGSSNAGISSRSSSSSGNGSVDNDDTEVAVELDTGAESVGRNSGGYIELSVVRSTHGKDASTVDNNSISGTGINSNGSSSSSRSSNGVSGSNGVRGVIGHGYESPDVTSPEGIVYEVA